MKNKTRYLFTAALLIALRAFPQSLELQLQHANSQKFTGSLYVYGFKNGEKNAVVAIYRLDSLLNKTDSSFLDIGKVSTADFLDLYSDTLHNFLNIYLQEKEKKLVSILRFNRLFEKVALINSVDVARLNSAGVFANDVLYEGQNVYAIKIEGDSTGKQFFLNKYTLKSEFQNFEYTFKWQFPFERKNVESAHIFFTTSKHVYLFVHRSGEMPGQWVLQIDAQTGKFVRGSKLNEKNETNTYEYTTSLFEAKKRSLVLFGQKFNDKELKAGDQKLSFTSQSQVNLFFAEIDSSGEVKTRQEFKIPIISQKGEQTNSEGFILRMPSIQRNKFGDYLVEADLFKLQFPDECFRYVNTLPLIFKSSEEKLVLQKTTINSNKNIDDLYATRDKMDKNGRLCYEDNFYHDRLFFQRLISPGKLAFKTDTGQQPMWVLIKSDPKKNKIHYFVLRPKPKIYQLEKTASIESSSRPNFITLSPSRFVITRQVDSGKYELKLYNW
ncbi:MAG: hypothetical protein PSX36_08355 [bacterium]|nr:hypothetical protein [bacterium]